MSGVNQATATTAASSSSSTAPTVRGCSITQQSTPSASVAVQDNEQADDDDNSDADEADDADDDAANTNTTTTTGADSQTAKQRRKKKSKAAAKLRKKLGLSSPSTTTETSTSPSLKHLASGTSTGGKISDDVVSQVRTAVAAEHGTAAAQGVNKHNLAKVMAMMNLERDAMLKSQDSKQKAQKAIADHKFWKTQPVMKPNDSPVLDDEGSIEPSVAPEKVRSEAYPLPADFEWVTIDVDDAAELKEVYDLLSANYVEDDDATFRFDYSPEFLHWVLKHPGYHKSWHIGVRVISTNKLVAFISGIPHELRVREKSYQSTEINFLCVHKKLRSKRLAPVLIKEVTRRCHLTGVFHAIYTVGSVLPTPVSCARYYHRTINARKLTEIGFSAVPHNMSLEQHVRRFELPKSTNLPGLREMEARDVAQVGKLMRRYMRRFDMAARFSDEEVAHVLLSGRGRQVEGGKREGQVTWTYVVEREGRVTDMFSFYSLPSSVLDNDKHKVLNAAYLFYYATDVVFDTQIDQENQASSSTSTSERAAALAAGKAPWQCNSLTNLTASELLDESRVPCWDSEPSHVKSLLKQRLNSLIYTLLILARNHAFDVVNCTTVMDNALFLADQKFGPGDGFLRYYLFNWRTRPIAGGMGSRPGESELDPVQAYARSVVKSAGAAADTQEAKSLAEQLIRKAAKNPADVGSGNGIVMV